MRGFSRTRARADVTLLIAAMLISCVMMSARHHQVARNDRFLGDYANTHTHAFNIFDLSICRLCANAANWQCARARARLHCVSDELDSIVRAIDFEFETMLFLCVQMTFLSMCVCLDVARVIGNLRLRARAC